MEPTQRRALSYFLFFGMPAALVVVSALQGILLGMLGGMVWLGVGVLFASPAAAHDGAP